MSWEQVGALIGAVVAIVFIGMIWIALRLKRLNHRLEETLQEVSQMRGDLTAWEKELRTVRTEAQTMRGELQSTRGELQNLRSEMHDHWSTMLSVKQVLRRDLSDQTHAGDALTAAPQPARQAPEPIVSPAAPEAQEKSTASDWLWRETLRRLSG